MTTLKVVCDLEDKIFSAKFGNVKSSDEIISLLFYLIDKEFGKMRLLYFDSDFNDWVDFGPKVKIEEVPPVLKLKCVMVTSGSFYEGKDYKTVRHEEEINSLTKEERPRDEAIDCSFPEINLVTPGGSKKNLVENVLDESVDDDLIDSPYSATGNGIEGVFEIEDDIPLEAFSGLDLD